MTPDDLEPLDPDASALRTLDDHARAAAEGLRRATAVAAPPLGGRPLGRDARLSASDQPALAFAGRRPRPRLVILGLAAAAVIVAAVGVVVTRPGTHHQPNTPIASATTAAPPTTGGPTTLRPSTAATVTITPHTGLADLQIVHVVANGFVPGETYTATECANKGAAIDPSINCVGSDQQGSGSAIADATGTVSMYVMVSTMFQCAVFACSPGPPPPSDGAPPGVITVDCSTAPGCVIRVTGGNQEPATGTLSFAPEPPGLNEVLVPDTTTTLG